jgi:hypothetical protein
MKHKKVEKLARDLKDTQPYESIYNVIEECKQERKKKKILEFFVERFNHVSIRNMFYQIVKFFNLYL